MGLPDADKSDQKIPWKSPQLPLWYTRVALSITLRYHENPASNSKYGKPSIFAIIKNPVVPSSDITKRWRILWKIHHLRYSNVANSQQGAEISLGKSGHPLRFHGLVVGLTHLRGVQNPMVLWWFYDGFMMVLWWFYDGFMMVLWLFYDGFMMVLWWFYDGFMMVLWWFYDGFMMVLWWFYMVLYMVVWWIIMIVPNVPLLWGSLTPVTTLSSRNRLSMLDGQHPQSRATGPSWTNLSTSLVELIGHNAGVSGSGGVPTHGKQLALAPAWTPTRALGFWEVPTLTCAWHPALQMLQQNPTYTSTGPWWKSATLLGVGVFPYSR